MTSVRFLDGLTVVELGDGIAGSVAGATLASLGATVHKAVGKTRTHAVHAPVIGAAPSSAILATLDREKRTVDLSTAEELATTADIVLVDSVDHPTPTPAAEGVVVTITPFGLTGPNAGRAGGELIAGAAGGLLGTVEPEAGGRPVSPPGFVALRAVGAVAALAALHGLDEHRRSGEPTAVDVSAQEAVVFTAALPECAHVLFDCPGRAGSGRYVAPSGVFPCADGHVRIVAVENHQWTGMVAALDAPAWTEGLDERAARAEHAAMINERVAEWTATRQKSECADLLQRHGVPATPINLPREVLDAPQLEHRGVVQRAELEGLEATVLGPPWRPQLVDADVERPAGIRELRIVELTHVLAGPIVGALLGGMGARVVRVEDRDRLDIYRRTGPFAGGVAGEERGAYFGVANFSKASVVAEGSVVAEVAAQLLDRSDVLIENVGQSRLDRLGVKLDRLAERGVLALRVSGFGADGPQANYRVYASNVQSYGGLAWMTRDHHGELARFGSVLADPLSSVIGATVIAAWALGPERGHGGVVDLAMVEVVAGCIAEYVAAASVGVEVEPPLGNDLHPYAPHGVYETADERWVAIAVHDDDEWMSLVDALGAPADLDRAEWREGSARFAERRKVDEELEAVLATLEAAKVVTTLADAGLRVAEVARGADLVVDEHLGSRGFFPAVPHPDLGTVQIVGLPWRFAEQGPIPIAGAPVLGSTTPAEALERFGER